MTSLKFYLNGFNMDTPILTVHSSSKPKAEEQANSKTDCKFFSWMLKIDSYDDYWYHWSFQDNVLQNLIGIS